MSTGSRVAPDVVVTGSSVVDAEEFATCLGSTDVVDVSVNVSAVVLTCFPGLSVGTVSSTAITEVPISGYCYEFP